jgi:hypothetical protein
MPDPAKHSSRPATIGVYDSPAWWKTRRFWRIALPVAAAVGSLVIWYAILA